MVVDVIGRIKEANESRIASTLPRRLIKLTEELGELAEAYLGVTSDSNYKNKTFDDFLEEAADVIIVAVDIGLTSVGQNLTPEEIRLQLEEMIIKKLAKWKAQQLNKINSED